LQGADALARAHGGMAFGHGVDHVLEPGKELGRNDNGDPDHEGTFRSPLMQGQVCIRHQLAQALA